MSTSLSDSYIDYLDENVLPLLGTQPFGYFSRSLIPYRALKSMIETMDIGGVADIKFREGECCICLESFNEKSDVVTTKCNHRFHAACLACLLIKNRKRSVATCPLCRTPEAEFYPDGPDGATIHFLSMILLNASAVEKSHDSYMRHIHLRLKVLQYRLELSSWLDKLANSNYWRTMRREAEELQCMLDAAEFMGATNRDGFSRLLERFEARHAANSGVVAAACRERLSAMAFACDAEPHCGSIAAARAELAKSGLLPRARGLQKAGPARHCPA